MTNLSFIVLTNVQLIGIIVAVVVVVAVVLILARAQKSRRLRTRFGPEYSRAVQESGSAARGEERLAKLEQRVERFKIRRAFSFRPVPICGGLAAGASEIR